MKFIQKVYYLILIILISGCKAIPPEITIPDPYKQAKDIAIFIDGTAFKPADSSNIYKLYENTIKRDDLLSFYTVGVGAGPDAKRAGELLGVGVSVDVQNAYRFICLNYSKTNDDRIHLFGFSRGAYTCKIISNLVYLAGVINFDNIQDEKSQRKLIRKLYKAYLGKKTTNERKNAINLVLEKWEQKNKITVKRRQNINIETLNLFDTVEALGTPNGRYNPCCPNKNHLDQFTNIKKVNHAVSLDDNRARIFTPILATCDCIESNSKQKVNEVWFSGAHSDVGGGYKNDSIPSLPDDKLSYVPLKWMQKQVENHNLFNNKTRIDSSHILGLIHDAQIKYKGAFLRRNRYLNKYRERTLTFNEGRIKIHQSVIERLEKGVIPTFKRVEKNKNKRKKIDSKDWFETAPFNKCFTKKDVGFIFDKSCEFIEVIH